VGNAAFGVFQGSLTAVFSIARCSRRILVRRQVPQTAVRTLLVVFRPPGCNLPLRVEQVLKPAYVQTFFPQPSVKTFHARILRRLARLNVDQLDLPLHAPRQKMPAGELRTVVAADRLRHSPLGRDLFQHARHSAAGETGIHFQGQALAGKSIDHAQHPNRPPALHRIVHEIERPLLVRRGPRRQRLSRPHAMFSLLSPKHQSRLPIHPMHSLVIHCFSRPRQQHMQPPISGPRLLPRQLHQPRPQLVIRACRLIAVTRYRHRHQPANPALARCVFHPQPTCIRPLVHELHPFFAISAFNISLSKLRSTTSFFKRVFSSRNCLASCASLTVTPPYFAFHA